MHGINNIQFSALYINAEAVTRVHGAEQVEHLAQLQQSPAVSELDKNGVDVYVTADHFRCGEEPFPAVYIPYFHLKEQDQWYTSHGLPTTISSHFISEYGKRVLSPLKRRLSSYIQPVPPEEVPDVKTKFPKQF